jgi:hypothetical protein
MPCRHGEHAAPYLTSRVVLAIASRRTGSIGISVERDAVKGM